MADRDDFGQLAVALAKAQREFGPLNRSKTVEVKTKTGGTYTFAYAPLDAILGQVRKPLADNGFALTQLLDADGLVTMLIHSSGAYLRGVVPLPETSDVQAFGSAITYLRRYSVQAILGLAAEEDDDGTRAAGHTARTTSVPAGQRVPTTDSTPSGASTPERYDTGYWQAAGKAGIGKPPVDGELRQTPDGGAFGFTITDEKKKRWQCIALGDLALPVSLVWESLVGQDVRVAGKGELVGWTQKDEKTGVERNMPPFRRIYIDHLESAEIVLPAVTEQEKAGAPPAVEDEALDLANDVYHELTPETEAELDALEVKWPEPA